MYDTDSQAYLFVYPDSLGCNSKSFLKHHRWGYAVQSKDKTHSAKQSCVIYKIQYLFSNNKYVIRLAMLVLEGK